MTNVHSLAEKIVGRRTEDLLACASPALRADCAGYFAAEFASEEVSEAFRAAAEPILKVFAEDAVLEVREAIVHQLKCCPFLPPSLARTLAHDVEVVALPVIRYSTVLTDENLVEIIRLGSETRQIAVAQRDTISEPVSGALIDTENGRVVSTLLANAGAAIGEIALHRVTACFGDDVRVQTLLARRPALPLSITERLFALASDEIRRILIERHDLPAELADQVVSLGHEAAVVKRVSEQDSVLDVERLAASMQAGGLLGATMMLRALCQGDVQFFEAAVATKAGTTADDARRHLYDSSDEEFTALFSRTDLPKALFRAFRIVVRLYLEMKQDNPAAWQRGFTLRAVNRLVEQYPEVSPKSLDHVLSQISRRVIGPNKKGPPRPRIETVPPGQTTH